MSDTDEIDRYAKDPNSLMQLCRDVIDRLDSGTDDTDIGEQETQLRQIAKPSDHLEKAGVSVPDVFRAEKTRLAAALGHQPSLA